MNRRFVSAFCAALVLTVSWRPAPAASPLDYCPAEAEVIVWANVKQLARPLADFAKVEAGHDHVTPVAQVVKNMTEVDVFTDIEEAALFARIDQPDAVVIAVRGTFRQPQKLVDVVRLNPGYSSSTVNGIEVHKWTDDGERLACFPQADLLLIATSAKAMDAAMQSPQNGFMKSEAARRLPKDLAKHGSWGAIIHLPNATGDFDHFADTVGLSMVVATGDFDGTNVSLSAQAFADTDELEGEYDNILNGMYSAMKLMKTEHPALAILAEHVTVVTGDEEGAPGARLEMPLAKLRELKDLD